MQASKRAGFTLIELIVVVGILGVLIGIVVPQLLNARGNANNSAAQAYAHNLAVWVASGDAAGAGSFAGSCTSNALQQEGAPPELQGSVRSCRVDYVNSHYTVTVTSVTGWGGPLNNGVFTSTY